MIRYFEITNPGNSGCSVQLIGRDRNFSVKKTSNSRAYDKRLRLQMAKQQQLFKTQLNGIIIPQVIRSGTNWYEMEYISMLDSISFFERSNPEMIKKRILLLIDFINSCIEQSPVKQLDKNVFLRKIGNIKRLAKKMFGKNIMPDLKKK